MSTNRSTIVGNLTRDPEVRYLPQGLTVTEFTVAVNERTRGGKETTAFIRCVAWDELAVRIGDTARRGSRVFIDGKLITEQWVDKTTNQQREQTKVRVGTFEVLAPRPAPSPVPEERTPSPVAPSGTDLDDLPF